MKNINNLVESNFNFTLNEHRLMYLATRQLRSIFMKMNIKPSEIRSSYKNLNFDVIKIFVIDLKHEYKIKGNNMYGVLEEAAEHLDKFEFMYLKDDGFQELTRLGAFKYNAKEKCVEIMFNPDLIVDIISLRELYNDHKYSAIQGFKRTSSFRIYEILKGHTENEGRTLKIEDLKRKLGLELDNYADNYEFKRSIVQRSIKEITELTDITEIKVEEILEGKKIVGLNFKIKVEPFVNNQLIDPLYRASKEEIDRMSQVLGIELTEAQAESLIWIVLTTISSRKLDVGFYEYLEQLKNTNVIWSLI